MTREQFIDELEAELPDVMAQIRPDECGLLHCEVGALRRATETAMDAGQCWTAERHFRFVERAYATAASDLRNALEVSYLRDLAFGVLTETRRQVVRERMPHALRAVLAGYRAEWR